MFTLQRYGINDRINGRQEMGLKKMWYQFLLNHLWLAKRLRMSVIHLPPGVYEYPQKINIEGISIIGAGKWQTILIPPSSHSRHFSEPSRDEIIERMKEHQDEKDRLEELLK